MNSGSGAANAGRNNGLGHDQVKRTVCASSTSNFGRSPFGNSCSGNPLGDSSGFSAMSSNQ